MRRYWWLLLLIGLVVPAGARGQDDDKDPAKLFARAQGLLKDDKVDDALSAVKKAVAQDPKNDRYLAFASHVAQRAGQYADAIQFAQQAIKINDQVAVYHALVAFGACNVQDLDLCRDACKKALTLSRQSLDPDSYRELLILNDLIGVRKLRFTWSLNPKKGLAQVGSYPVAVPPEKIPGQSATYEVTGARSFKVVKQGVNTVLQVVPQAGQTIELVLNVTVDPHSYKKDLAKYEKKPVPKDIQVFLGASESINPKSPVLMKIARDCKDDSAIVTVKNIMAWQKKHLKYKFDEKATNKSDFNSVDEVVKRGEGECRAWSTLFTGLCRAAGVPTRHFWGMVLIVPDKKNPKGAIRSHVWAEVYLTGAGWVPVDPQEPNTFGFIPNTYVRIFTDTRKLRTSMEHLPVLNLLAMGSEGFRYERVK